MLLGDRTEAECRAGILGADRPAVLLGGVRDFAVGGQPERVGRTSR